MDELIAALEGCLRAARAAADAIRSSPYGPQGMELLVSATDSLAETFALLLKSHDASARELRAAMERANPYANDRN